jgi:hypothetical protein
MLTGAALMLAFYVVIAITKTQPSPLLVFPVNFLGYGFLSVGFVLRMRERHQAQEDALKESKDDAPEEESRGPAPEEE